jgi:predicted dehydrogenase
MDMSFSARHCGLGETMPLAISRMRTHAFPGLRESSIPNVGRGVQARSFPGLGEEPERGQTMVSTDGLRIGVVGAGYWGSKHVRTMSSLAEVAQVAVVDPSQERVRALQRGYPALAAFASLDEALDFVDAVVIATPPSLHAPLALQAVRAHKHVMVEKPLATSVADARAIMDAADDEGVVAMVGHTFEYHAAVWALRDIVGRPDFGELYYLDTARLNMGLYQHDVNVVWDLAPHDISILNYLVGSTPSSVECWGSRHAHNGLEDIAHLRLYYDEPAVEATVHVSWLHPCKTRRVTAVGSEQMVVFDDLATEERIRVHNKSVQQPVRKPDDLTQAPMSYRYGDVVAPYVVVHEPLAVEDRHFADCVASGTPPVTDARNGVAVVETLEAADLSLRTGRRVDLASAPAVLDAPVLADRAEREAPAIPAQRRSPLGAEAAV